MIIKSNNKKGNTARLGIADMEDMTESGTSDEEFKKQFGTCCGGTMSNTNIMEKSQCI